AAIKQYRRDIVLETSSTTSYIKPLMNSTVLTVNNYSYHSINYTESASSYHTLTTSLPVRSIVTPISVSNSKT
ncbi:11107_t:CDS:1, partial [Scutellospora calospora]